MPLDQVVNTDLERVESESLKGIAKMEMEIKSVEAELSKETNVYNCNFAKNSKELSALRLSLSKALRRWRWKSNQWRPSSSRLMTVDLCAKITDSKPSFQFQTNELVTQLDDKGEHFKFWPS